MSHDLPCAVVGGHICLDVIPDFGPEGSAAPDGTIHEILQPGRLVEIGPAFLCTGGPVSNTGLALQRLGIPTFLNAKIGADPFGQVVHRLVESFGPNLVRGIRVNPLATTSYSMILSRPGMDRLILHHPGANHTFTAQDVDYTLLSSASLFHFGYPPVMRSMYANGGQGLVELFQQVKQTGVTTSLDVSYPDPTSPGGRVDWRAILKAALPCVDIFLPGFEELLVMLRPAEAEALAGRGRLLDQATPALLHDLSAELIQMGVRVAVIKLGERGLYLRTASAAALEGMGRACPRDLAGWAEREIWAPCYRVDVVGTTGAGDTTIAGFLAGLLRGLGPQAALNSAAAVGACNVEAADALSGLLSWEETQARIRSGWERLPLNIDDPNWTWEPRNQLWRCKDADFN